MEDISLIAWPNGPSESDRQRWLELIETHGSLAHVPPKSGTNPFARKPTLVHAPRSTAIVVVGGVEAGSIGWTLGELPALVVSAKEGAVDDVRRVAEDVAAKLGARFVRDESTA
jgi:hypothetical protein